MRQRQNSKVNKYYIRIDNLKLKLLEIYKTTKKIISKLPLKENAKMGKNTIFTQSY